jgi:hypothetical protein
MKIPLSQVNLSQLFSKWLYFFSSQNSKEMCVLITLGVETESQYCSFTTKMNKSNKSPYFSILLLFGSVEKEFTPITIRVWSKIHTTI